jgi:Arc/MetJ-type ribon-helix-helix transcriptional regulator
MVNQGSKQMNHPGSTPRIVHAKASKASKAAKPSRAVVDVAASRPAVVPAADEAGDATARAPGRGRVSESEKLTINLGAVDLGSIDLLVAEGFFSNRSDLIRTAVRNLLADHRDIINGALARQERTLGMRRITRAELEALRDAGQSVRIGVVGLAVIDDDVPADLARQTIAQLSVLGSLQASPAVRKALAGRLN